MTIHISGVWYFISFPLPAGLFLHHSLFFHLCINCVNENKHTAKLEKQWRSETEHHQGTPVFISYKGSS